jgi:1,2-diacylglycerol 3-beta-glucosyltransferase
MLLTTLILVVVAAPAVIACSYLLGQTLLSSRLPVLQPSRRDLRFDIVVAAHNESSVIAQTVTNLKALNWPSENFRILVVADNCTDATASLAREAGATVIERQDASRRGKGYALLCAFEHLKAQQWSNAIAVVDADTQASKNLLEAFASRIERGAHAVQVHYGILNPNESWRTRLLTVAMAAYHVVRSRARERLGVSCGIRGTGWCVTHESLERVPYNSFSLTEDIEYGIALGLSGYRVHYAGEAEASQEMTSDPGVAGNQRQRWERGRFQLIRAQTLALLGAALRRRSPVCLDLALDLLVLPVSYLALNVATLLCLAMLAAHYGMASSVWVWLSGCCIAALSFYILRGWQLSDTGVRGLLDLVGAPIFVAWKVMLMLKRRGQGGWVRTERRQT